MRTNSERTAALLNISVRAAIHFHRQVREQMNSSVTTDMVRRGVELYLNRFPERRPSPRALVSFFYGLEKERQEREEQSELDYLLSDWNAREKQKELEKFGWFYEDWDTHYLATFEYAIGEKEWEDPWELEQLSRADSLIDEWVNARGDEDYAETPRLVKEKNRKRKIKQICEEHGINTLVHFTRIENLESILRRGLLSRCAMREYRIENAVFNDLQRLDNHPDAVCLSISFPNYKMFYRYRQDNQADWVIILLDAAILWELDCAFCHENAASNTVREIRLQQRKEVEAFETLFSDYQGHVRSCANLPANYTTHPQAEVLVFDPIPTRYLKEVHFRDKYTLKPWSSGDEHVFWCQFLAKQEYFKYRKDHSLW